MTERTKKNTVLHCMYAEKFIGPYLKFLSKHFDISQHKFLIRKDKKYSIQDNINTIFVKDGESKISRINRYISEIKKADKIIIHGILNKEMWLILFFQPWILKKIYWLVWGGDLYYFVNKSKNIKSYLFEKLVIHFVIKNIAYIVTPVKGDYELSKKRYGAKGKWINCLWYLSNIYHKTSEKKITNKKNSNKVNILMGNSAHETNNHSELFEILLPYKNKDIIIHCPLSYGPQEYASKITAIGKRQFGEKFIPIFKFMSFTEYQQFLKKIDIVLYGHKRQQALGNTISLLYMGKKVYMRNDVSQWDLYKNLKIKIYNKDLFNLTKISKTIAQKNTSIVEGYFSEEKLIEQWTHIFYN
jgi:dTDP-N-acetylfucosamine:lipid II N-acetylfucosaminyltransferase